MWEVVVSDRNTEVVVLQRNVGQYSRLTVCAGLNAGCDCCGVGGVFAESQTLIKFEHTTFRGVIGGSEQTKGSGLIRDESELISHINSTRLCRYCLLRV